MSVGVILLILAAVAAIAVVVINRVSGPRPDRPMAGKEHDAGAPARGEAPRHGGARTDDRPGDPGQEGMNPARPGDPAPGPSDGDGNDDGAHRTS